MGADAGWCRNLILLRSFDRLFDDSCERFFANGIAAENDGVLTLTLSKRSPTAAQISVN